MTRRKWVQIEGQLVEVDPNTYQPAGRVADSALWGDRHYEGAQAPDGSDISSRTKHREYMARTGLTTVDDFSGQWAQQAKAREDFYTSGGDHRARREDLARAIYRGRS
jgi:hypothetical protein